MMKRCVLLSAPFSAKLTILVIPIFSVLATTAQAQAFDSYFAEAGRSSNANFYKLGGQKSVDYAWLSQKNLHLIWEMNVARFNLRKYQNVSGRTRSINMLGLTPILRWQGNARQGIFGEIGIGLNYMSSHYNNAGKESGSKFEFGDHVGIGYSFGNFAEITLKYQHFSNGGFSHPNPAINFTTIKFAYAF